MFNFVEVMVAADAGVLVCLDTGNQHLLSQVQAEVTLYCLCWPPGLKDTQQYWEALQLMLVWIILNLFLSWILCQKRVQCDKITHGWFWLKIENTKTNQKHNSHEIYYLIKPWWEPRQMFHSTSFCPWYLRTWSIWYDGQASFCNSLRCWLHPSLAWLSCWLGPCPSVHVLSLATYRFPCQWCLTRNCIGCILQDSTSPWAAWFYTRRPSTSSWYLCGLSFWSGTDF